MSDKNEPNEKEIGGMKLPNGFAVGPIYFSKDGKAASSIIMQSAIIAFDFGVTNALNRLNKTSLPIDEFQTEFNSLVGNLISETLIYFQNRLKPIVKRSEGQFNKINDAAKAYRKTGIDIGDMCDLVFLKAISDVRGQKRHTDRRYDSDYTINGIAYDTMEKLRELAKKVRDEVRGFDEKLAGNHKDYNIKVIKAPNSMSIELTALNHVFDLTRGGKTVPKKPKSSTGPIS